MEPVGFTVGEEVPRGSWVGQGALSGGAFVACDEKDVEDTGNHREGILMADRYVQDIEWRDGAFYVSSVPRLGHPFGMPVVQYFVD